MPVARSPFLSEIATNSSAEIALPALARSATMPASCVPSESLTSFETLASSPATAVLASLADPAAAFAERLAAVADPAAAVWDAAAVVTEAAALPASVAALEAWVCADEADAPASVALLDAV